MKRPQLSEASLEQLAIAVIQIIDDKGKVRQFKLEDILKPWVVAQYPIAPESSTEQPNE